MELYILITFKVISGEGGQEFIVLPSPEADAAEKKKDSIFH